MLIVEGVNKVFVHMPKTGGMAFNNAIRKKHPKLRYHCYHQNIETVPEKYKDYPRVGLIRNPINWYISFYNHDLRMKRKGTVNFSPIIKILSNNFNLNFRDTLPRMLNLGEFFNKKENYELLRQELQDIVTVKNYDIVTMSYPDLSNIGQVGDTLYDHWYKFVGLEKATTYRLEDKTMPFAENMQVVNEGYKVDLSKIYTKEMIKQIKEKDEKYIYR